MTRPLPASRRLTAYASAPAPAPIRATLFTATGRDATKRLTEEEARLQKEYVRTFKRPCKIPLFFASWGQLGSTVHGLTAHATAEQAADLAFLQSAASPSTT